MDLGGATIIFAQNWNFQLKFVLVNHFWKKMTSRQFKIHFLYKFESKMPQNRTVSKQPLSKKMFQNGIFQGQKLLKPISCLNLQFVFQIAIQKSHFGTFSYLGVAVNQSSFVAFFDPYLCKKWNLNHIEVIFFQKQFTITNFSSKFEF